MMLGAAVPQTATCAAAGAIHTQRTCIASSSLQTLLHPEQIFVLQTHTRFFLVLHNG